MKNYLAVDTSGNHLCVIACKNGKTHSVFLPDCAMKHSVSVLPAIDEALKCRQTGEEKTIVFGLTGTGYFDMMSYEKFHDGKMSDYVPTDEEIEKSLSKLPKV